MFRITFVVFVVFVDFVGLDTTGASIVCELLLLGSEASDIAVLDMVVEKLKSFA